MSAFAGPIECYKIARSEEEGGLNLTAENAAKLCSGAETNGPIKCFKNTYRNDKIDPYLYMDDVIVLCQRAK